MNLLPRYSPFSRCLAGAGFLLALSLGSCTEEKKAVVPAPTPPPAPPANSEAKDYNAYTELVWSDEFNGGALDQAKWGFDLGAGGWGNRELQTYTNSTENVFTGGGILTIKAVKPISGSPAYTSGRILTKGKRSFVFGRIDVRAKIPKGKGIWPAIWMLGADIDQNNWPKCGEIDIMELRGSKPRELLSTMHYANAAGTRELKGTTAVQPADLSDAFHVYSMVRSQDQIRVYIDGTQFYSFGKADVGSGPYPFNNPFFVILNVAVGGDFDGDPNATTTFPQQMDVDYVKFFQYK
ncbi:MAG TPA: glycoside hydrolase family 16 protein [Hymenobacter sp.]|jgi:beta-glucanase (GH16 family)|uniref:glycoside hydrolase family 16 protein n=1 Tax=Hymenobacter sp. TaxID=1898978 RepID=UPI002ED9E605